MKSARMGDEQITLKGTDILTKMGSGSATNIGNQFYRRSINLNKPRFVVASGTDRPKLVESIYNMIRQGAGRFVREDCRTKKWRLMSDKEAKEKIRQALSANKEQTIAFIQNYGEGEEGAERAIEAMQIETEIDPQNVATPGFKPATMVGDYEEEYNDSYFDHRMMENIDNTVRQVALNAEDRWNEIRMDLDCTEDEVQEQHFKDNISDTTETPGGEPSSSSFVAVRGKGKKSSSLGAFNQFIDEETLKNSALSPIAEDAHQKIQPPRKKNDDPLNYRASYRHQKKCTCCSKISRNSGESTSSSKLAGKKNSSLGLLSIETKSSDGDSSFQVCTSVLFCGCSSTGSLPSSCSDLTWGEDVLTVDDVKKMDIPQETREKILRSPHWRRYSLSQHEIASPHKSSSSTNANHGHDAVEGSIIGSSYLGADNMSISSAEVSAVGSISSVMLLKLASGGGSSISRSAQRDADPGEKSIISAASLQDFMERSFGSRNLVDSRGGQDEFRFEEEWEEFEA